MGNIYNRLKDYRRAEYYYREMMSLIKDARDERNKELGYHLSLDENAAEYLFGKFLTEQGHFVEAKNHLEKALLPPPMPPASKLSEIYYLLFKVDSASGNYNDAINNLKRRSAFNDSLFSIAKNRQIQEINVKYETAFKEQSIKALESREVQAKLIRDIQASQIARIRAERKKQQAELNQATLERANQAVMLKSLDLERKNQRIILQRVNLQRRGQQAELKQAQLQRDIQINELKRSRFQRNITLAGIIMVSLIFFLAYRGFRNKTKSNRQLLIQQKKINQQNRKLEGLLKEQDWLLKEVHHRVKNNLQIVMSLLNTQAEYLKNKGARNAILESQNRVRAIAIIHQKLYSTDNRSSIGMIGYVTDLIESLNECFSTSKRGIRFIQDIDTVVVDISQAVPLGLILNEAITNSIKYAFGDNGGEINIKLKLLEPNHLLLKIRDNGKGFPDLFNIDFVDSLGMEMIKALSGQLEGDLQIENDMGAIITLQFKRQTSQTVESNIWVPIQ